MHDPAAADRPQLTIDVVSDVVCPWCYLGKRRLEKALAQLPDVDVTVRFRPFFLSPETPRAGMDRKAYLESKFGSVETYEGMAQRVASAAAEEGLTYNFRSVSRQPNTLDSHRLILWAGERAPEMKQALMEAYFRDGRDLSNPDTLVEIAAAQGFDADETRRRLAGDEDVANVEQSARAAAEAGVTGVPTFIFDGRYAVSGAQPPDVLAGAVRQILAMRESTETR